MRLSKIGLFILFSAMLASLACGPQASQQGTWSRDDGFSHKVTPKATEPAEK